jgi:hypothetical protein
MVTSEKSDTSDYAEGSKKNMPDDSLLSAGGACHQIQQSRQAVIYWENPEASRMWKLKELLALAGVMKE